MTLSAPLSVLTPADCAALAWLVFAWAAVGWIVEHPPRSRLSVSVLMDGYRRRWMREMVTRQPRIFDAAVMDNLRQGVSFYASASMIALGGGAAVIGNAERLAATAEELSLPPAAALVWQVKLAVVLLFVANGFLKFVWSHRLFGYSAIVMAAVPNEQGDPGCYPMAERAAGINITAARNFNRGLRSVYFALGAAAWLLGPLALAAAATLTLIVLLRREFASASRQLLVGGG
ncbi:MAG: DUF599 domain-containing protein [Paracoccaceae bacterium]